MDINDTRKRIDLLDDVLLRIFNERARLALEIGHAKKELNLPVFDPAREKRIFNRMKEDNPGPLDDDAIVRLFERVVDEGLGGPAGKTAPCRDAAHGSKLSVAPSQSRASRNWATSILPLRKPVAQ